MNEQGGPWPAYTVGYGESFEDDELADAAGDSALLGRAACDGEARPGRIRAIAAKNRGMSGRTNRSFVHRADVFRLSARATGCQSSSDWPGT